MKRVFFALTAVLLVLFSQPVLIGAAQQPTPSDNEVNELAREMYCPVCENTPLDVCPTKACAQWRDLIRQKLQEGWSKEQVKEYFAAQYGDQVLAEPSASGSNRLIYILPPILILAAGVLVFSVIKTAKKRSSSVQISNVVQPNPSANPYLDQVEDELERYKKR